MKILVPTSWKDVNVNQFIELSKVKSLGFDELDTQLRILSILTGVEDDVLLQLPISEIKRMSLMTDFIKHNQSKKEIDFTIKLNGKKFRVEWDATKLVAGEYIDIQKYIESGATENIHNIIAAYLKPVNFFGFIKKSCYEQTQDGRYIQSLESRNITAKLILNHMNMEDVFALNGFFLNRWKKLIGGTRHYLELQNKKAMKDLKRKLKKEGLPQHMVGI